MNVEQHVRDSWGGVRPLRLLNPVGNGLAQLAAYACHGTYGLTRGNLPHIINAALNADAPDALALLRARRGGPRHRHTAKEPDELAPLHSITPSARPDSGRGTVMPSALVVLTCIR
jgi:hypothetical protein